ncbi:MAG TPA: APC family permease [Streptosporangiaceae bacterium]|jgi:amino acid transporter|nr:APC family permease [Streptosporangiaceae bacterium]
MTARSGTGREADDQAAGAPDPDALLPALDERQLSVLRRVGLEWDRASGDPQAWRRALPLDPNLGSYPEADEIRPTRLGRFVPVAGRDGQLPAIEATDEAEAPLTLPGRIAYRVRRVLLGPPLSTTAIATERMRKLVALPVLSADALSSVAYGPEAMLAVLVLAGSAGLGYSLPIAAAIALLMLAVGVSYRQTIRAYPHGGGSYIVASDNLGRVPGLVAAAGLLIDYVMTVAVSVASGAAAVTSAIPSLAPAAVPAGIGVIALLLAGNLRGVRQAGALFAAPTYAFIIAVAALITVGLAGATARGFHPVPPPRLTPIENAGVLLVLRAFASGATAMTGIEAVSNAVPAFKPVEWRNARTTLTWMIGLLIAMFAGIVVLVRLDGVVPRAGQTVLSQLAHRSFGGGFLYAFTQAATAAILLLAANTAYNDFPRVLFLLARSHHAPRLFLRIGDRLAFSNGIIVLSITATAIYAAFGGNTESLIPLYAVGVFLAFTMSQAGMVVHWWRRRDDAHWRRSLFFNATGGALSAIVFLTAALTKFTEGSWVALLAIGLIILISLRIRHHYHLVVAATALHLHAAEIPVRPLTPVTGDGARPWAEVRGEAAAEAETETEEQPEEIRHLIFVPVAVLDLPSMRALAYAASFRQPVLALHLSPTEDEAERFRHYWQTWGNHLPLEVIVSPHRAIVAPLVNYIWSLHRQRPDLTLTVILPELVVRHWWHRILHNWTAPQLRRALRPLPKVVVTTVPFHLPC